MKRFSLFLFIVLIMTGCKTKKVVASFSDLDGNWDVVEMNGRMLDPAETSQMISFDVERQMMSGNAGCNRMSGKMDYIIQQKNIIKFPRIATTRMACKDMKLEDELLKTLEKVVRFESVTENTPIDLIAFYGIDDAKLLIIKRKS